MVRSSSLMFVRRLQPRPLLILLIVMSLLLVGGAGVAHALGAGPRPAHSAQIVGNHFHALTLPCPQVVGRAFASCPPSTAGPCTLVNQSEIVGSPYGD